MRAKAGSTNVQKSCSETLFGPSFSRTEQLAKRRVAHGIGRCPGYVEPQSLAGSGPSTNPCRWERPLVAHPADWPWSSSIPHGQKQEFFRSRPVGWGDNPTGLPSRGNGGVVPHPTQLWKRFPGSTQAASRGTQRSSSLASPLPLCSHAPSRSLPCLSGSRPSGFVGCATASGRHDLLSVCSRSRSGIESCR
jgi:hypothetical protein